MNERFAPPEESVLKLQDAAPEDLQKMDIPDLYKMIHEHLDQKAVIDRFRDNVAFKVALIVGWLDAVTRAHLAEDQTYQHVNTLLMRSESRFIRSLKDLGVHVDVQSEISPKRFREKPHLIMSTHQGGGLETYVLAELLRRGGIPQYRYVMKDELVGLPIVGKAIAGRGPILVHRKELKNEETRQQEIERVGQEIVQALTQGENVLFFFEGTRSKSGAVAHTDARKDWCYRLNAAIAGAAKQYPDLDFGKALVVLDMLSVLPEAVEKKPTAAVRTNGDCTARILDADLLKVQEDPEDPYNPHTLFGKARTTLKDILIRRIQRYQGV